MDTDGEINDDFGFAYFYDKSDCETEIPNSTVSPDDMDTDSEIHNDFGCACFYDYPESNSDTRRLNDTTPIPSTNQLSDEREQELSAGMQHLEETIQNIEGTSSLITIIIQ